MSVCCLSLLSNYIQQALVECRHTVPVESKRAHFLSFTSVLNSKQINETITKDFSKIWN